MGFEAETLTTDIYNSKNMCPHFLAVQSQHQLKGLVQSREEILE
jgi:hypothetical protein